MHVLPRLKLFLHQICTIVFRGNNQRPMTLYREYTNVWRVITESCLLWKEWLCYRIWFIAVYQTLWRSSSKEEKRRLRLSTILPCCCKIVL